MGCTSIKSRADLQEVRRYTLGRAGVPVGNEERCRRVSLLKAPPTEKSEKIASI